MRKKSFFKNSFGIAFLLVVATLNIFILANVAESATNISATTTAHWAWNDLVGWMDFYNTQSITVGPQNLTGYASSSVGDISLDCHTTRNGDICSQGNGNYQVTNDFIGNLSGWGWNDQYGWISFDCNNNSGCGQSNYRAYIDGGGNFQNYAWNDAMGWLSFNCDNVGGCAASNFRVLSSWTATTTTGYLDSSTYDTGATNGAQLNSVLWRGNLPSGTAVRFQFATSNASSGPWTFVGADGTSGTYYNTGPDLSLRLDYTLHNNRRYFRYRVTLVSDYAQQLTPRVDDVIVNWSP
ncbi:MAG: hypothetical protein HY433_01960 [Candidatus Liptonbacteria bacterium]|nr:hypothetical protein [Candidatus Liptonbacteria bacterium]